MEISSLFTILLVLYHDFNSNFSEKIMINGSYQMLRELLFLRMIVNSQK